MSEKLKEECVLKVIGEVDLKGVSNGVFLYMCLPLALKGRQFGGVIRRRDSCDATIVPGDDEDTYLTGSQVNEYLTSDVFSLTPIQLQKTVTRLRRRIDGMNRKMEQREIRTRRRSSSASELSIPSEEMDAAEGNGELEEPYDWICWLQRKVYNLVGSWQNQVQLAA